MTAERPQASAENSGAVKATREDWLATALDLLVSEGVEQVKVLSIGARLGVSRSSFYWYFKSRKHLLDELLKTWEQTNTGAILRQAAAPAETITESVCNLFRCFVDLELFNPQLDFAVREWSRRSGPVRLVVDRSDAARLAAIAAMFERRGYGGDEAVIRARVLYYMQLGYYALEMGEPLEERLALVPGYLRAFTGREPRSAEVEALRAYARARN